MLRPLNPKSVRRPFARYSHGVEVPAGARLVFCAGQLGISVDDQVPADPAEQAKLCFEAIGAILAEAGMSLSDIVRLNAYVTDREAMAAYMPVRDSYVLDPPPASTLVIVAGFTRPEFRVEVEAVAAKVDAP
jgi:enamine deaminase RidA (YjgF/YER057c/UK114 family)